MIYNIEKERIYVGSSKDIGERLRGYKGLKIENKKLLKDVRNEGWGLYEIYYRIEIEENIDVRDTEGRLIDTILKIKVGKLGLYNNILEVMKGGYYAMIGEYDKKKKCGIK